MSDFEKNRAEYVQHMELQVKALQQQLNAIQADERWIPKIGGELDASTQKCRLTLAFGGKNQTALVSFTTLAENSVTDITTSMLTQAFQDLVNDRLRTVVEPEVQRLQASAQQITGIKQW